MLNNAFCDASTNPIRSMAGYLLTQCNKDIKTVQEEEIEVLNSKLAALTSHLETLVEANTKLKQKDEEWIKLFQKQQEYSTLPHPSSSVMSKPYNGCSQHNVQPPCIPPPKNFSSPLKLNRKKNNLSPSDDEIIVKKKKEVQVAQFDSSGPPTTYTNNSRKKQEQFSDAMKDVDDSSSEGDLIIDTQEFDEDSFEISKNLEEQSDKAFSNMPLLTDEEFIQLMEDSLQEKPLTMPKIITEAVVEKLDSAGIPIASSMSSGFFDYEPK